MSGRTQHVLLMAIALAVVSVGPLMFPAAQAGYSSLPVLATRFLIPAVLVLIVVSLVSRRWYPALQRSILWGALAGVIATVPLEIVRLIGFRLGFMPGNLPRLMGVLLLSRFALGPSFFSDLAGWTYHFWNGASFGILYVLFLGTERRWMGLLFGTAVGLGFLVSPVMISLGVGYFGLQFSYGLPATVLLAHLAFGAALGLFARRFLESQGSLIIASFRDLFSTSSPMPQDLRAK